MSASRLPPALLQSHRAAGPSQSRPWQDAATTARKQAGAGAAATRPTRSHASIWCQPSAASSWLLVALVVAMSAHIAQSAAAVPQSVLALPWWPSRSPAAPCSGTYNITATGSGVIAHSSALGSPYANGQVCEWTISTSLPNHRIKLVFNLFATECGWDYLYIFDGPTTSSPLTATLCGNRSTDYGYDDLFVSSSASLTVKFVADSLVFSDGFIGIFTAFDTSSSCTVDSDCKNGGSCSGSVCVCGPSYTGDFCQTQSNGVTFSPRERHSVAYDATADVMYLTFGRTFAVVTWPELGDFWSYNFATQAWSLLTPTNSANARPAARSGHYSWVSNGLLYIYGGVVRNSAVRDMWRYSPITNAWTQLLPRTSVVPPLSQDATYVVTPGSTPSSFKLYAMGGYVDSSSYTRSLYVFDSDSMSWTLLSPCPSGIGGGAAVYHPATQTIQIVTGYPITYSPSLAANIQLVYQYSIPSDSWATWSSQALSHNRYRSQAVYVAPDYALVFGGLEKGWDETRLGNDCVSGELQLLDLACGSWSHYSEPAIRKFRRSGFGMLVRNQMQLVLVGGYDGQLHNDLVQIDLSLLPAPSVAPPASNECGLVSSSLSFPAGCTATKNRDQCRASTYCSFGTTCSTCTLQPNCNWCNYACGYDNSTAPLPGLQFPMNSPSTPVSSGSTWFGLCPANIPVVASAALCPAVPQLAPAIPMVESVAYGGFTDFVFRIDQPYMDLNIMLSSVTPRDAQLRVTLLSVRPYTPTSVNGTLVQKASDPTRILGTQTIRVSWLNNQGVLFSQSSSPPPFPAISPTDPQYGTTADFTILAMYSMPLSDGTTISNNFKLADLFNLFLIFGFSVFVTVAVAQILSRVRRHNHVHDLVMLETRALANLPSEPPTLYTVKLDLSGIAKPTTRLTSVTSLMSVGSGSGGGGGGMHWRASARKSIVDAWNSARGSGSAILRSASMALGFTPHRYPIAAEQLAGFRRPLDPVTPVAVVCTTYLVVHPGAERYVHSGDLPPMSFATRIVHSGAPDRHPQMRKSVADNATFKTAGRHSSTAQVRRQPSWLAAGLERAASWLPGQQRASHTDRLPMTQIY
ncbi:hypothetical protein BC831DRAFT_503807 [Entophlyctis helioformis]|nr:hypothetical protein BC831DRAFT_503807 [Entophlyctis helioformis]